MVKLPTTVRPLALTITSCWRPVLERVTATQTMSSRLKTHPEARPTRRTLRDISAKCKQRKKVSEGEIDAIVWPTVLFYQTNELEIMNLADTDNDPPQNLQDNGTTPPVINQPPSTQSLLEDTLLASAEPMSCPCVDSATLPAKGIWVPTLLLGIYLLTLVW